MGFGGYAAVYPKPDPSLERQELKAQAEAMEAELEAIKKRLSEMEPGTDEA
jgi:hypothetical protein